MDARRQWNFLLSGATEDDNERPLEEEGSYFLKNKDSRDLQLGGAAKLSTHVVFFKDSPQLGYLSRTELFVPATM